jgi:hypothetical protein
MWSLRKRLIGNYEELSSPYDMKVIAFQLTAVWTNDVFCVCGMRMPRVDDIIIATWLIVHYHFCWRQCVCIFSLFNSLHPFDVPCPLITDVLELFVGHLIIRLNIRRYHFINQILTPLQKSLSLCLTNYLQLLMHSVVSLITTGSLCLTNYLHC